jgi:hypothetical protein
MMTLERLKEMNDEGIDVADHLVDADLYFEIGTLCEHVVDFKGDRTDEGYERVYRSILAAVLSS